MSVCMCMCVCERVCVYVCVFVRMRDSPMFGVWMSHGQKSYIQICTCPTRTNRKSLGVYVSACACIYICVCMCCRAHASCAVFSLALSSLMLLRHCRFLSSSFLSLSRYFCTSQYLIVCSVYTSTLCCALDAFMCRVMHTYTYAHIV